MTKDPRYFTHDDNAHDDLMIKAMIKKYGFEGYGWYWYLIEKLRGSSHYRMNNDALTLQMLAEDLKCSVEKLGQYLDDCVTFKLFSKQDGLFYSEALISRMIKLDNIRQGRAKGGYKRHGMDLPDNWE